MPLVSVKVASAVFVAVFGGARATKQSQVEVDWRSKHDRAHIMRSERESSRKSRTHPHLEPEAGALVQMESESAEGPCPFMKSSGTAHLQCTDGTLCDPRISPACCTLHGGRKKCPLEMPIMCAFKTCDGDHCCDTTCATYGGLKRCEQCSEALRGFRDDAYRGCQTLTRSGKVCQRWDTQSPHAHGKGQSSLVKYPLADLRENFCRNPDGALTIWCYTSDPGSRWEFCDAMPSFKESGAPKCGIALPLLGSRSHAHLPDAKITASSYFGNANVSGYGAMWRSRMDNSGSTWTAEEGDADPWIQWDFGTPKQIHKMQTKGRPDSSEEWVMNYKLAFSPDGDTWTLLDPIFEGNSDKNTLAENSIDPPIVASMVRLYPLKFHEKISLRAEVFGCSAPQQLVTVFRNAECCSGSNCNQATQLLNYVTWSKCHDECETNPQCMGFQHGKKNEDSEISRCTGNDLCACWLIDGACSEISVNKGYDAFLFKVPTIPLRLVPDAQLTPAERLAPELTSADAQLTSSYKGRVELFHDGEWGSVCSDLFSESAAKVVCGQIGLLGGKLLKKGSFPIGYGKIWMDNVVCTGNERKLWGCKNNGWGTHNCEHLTDVGVECLSPVGGQQKQLAIR